MKKKWKYETYACPSRIWEIFRLPKIQTECEKGTLYSYDKSLPIYMGLPTNLEN